MKIESAAPPTFLFGPYGLGTDIEAAALTTFLFGPYGLGTVIEEINGILPDVVDEKSNC